MCTRFRDPIRRGCALAFIILYVTWNCLLAAESAQAQQQTIRVVIDASFASSGQRFLEQLSGNLSGQARENVRIQSITLPPPEIAARLQDLPWDMAILSTGTLVDTKINTPAVAFDMPFVFPNMTAVSDLQHSAIGRAALSTMSGQGITGLVYLNAGVTLLANRADVKSPNELVGKTVAVFSTAQAAQLRKIGANPFQATQPAEARGALDQGAVDSVAINSTNPTSWVLPARGSLLTDSLKAQVAVVVTHNKSWNEIPFVYRAMISDAAISTSQGIDRSLIEAERPLLERAQSQGVSLARFSSEEASRATQQWISEQPESLRSTYSAVYDYVKSPAPKGPLDPIDSGRRGDVGTLYFATTRDDTGNSNFFFRFGDARTDVVKCGQIQFSKSNPSATTPQFAGAVTADTDACSAILVTALKSSKRLLLFVHGFNNRFSDAAERAIILKNKLGNDTEVVLWSWPSKRDGLAGNYDYDKESVTGVAQRRLVGLLRALRDASSAKPFSILAHSMGGWHVLGALQTLSDDNSPLKLGNIVLAAPDIPDDEFEFALKGLDSVTNRNTLYACGWDWALILSEQINAYPRAGTGGNNIVVSQGMDSIDVDATFSVNHSYVFESQDVLGDLSKIILTGADPDVAPRDLVKVPKATWRYWRFPH